MGTELVKYVGNISISDRELRKLRALSANEINKTKNRRRTMFGGLLIGSLILASGVFLKIADQEENVLPNVVLLAGIALIFFSGGAALMPGFYISSSPLARFECPSCKELMNCEGVWRCGTCNSANNMGSMGITTTPFTQCSSPGCPDPRPSAIACPICQKHVIIDAEQYRKLESNERPFDGVAVVGSNLANTVMNLIFDDLEQKPTHHHTQRQSSTKLDKTDL